MSVGNSGRIEEENYTISDNSTIFVAWLMSSYFLLKIQNITKSYHFL